MSENRTHYDVMGLKPEASADEVRKRFRELARKYHPDLHRDHPEYHEVFIRISAAWEVLGDANRRARYDLDLRDKARREAPKYKPTASTPKSEPAGKTFNSERERREAEKRRQQFARLLEGARDAYQRGHLRDAEQLCLQLLEIGNSAMAQEILGEIYERQGRTEEAVQHYTIAAQMTRNSARVMAKLNRALGIRRNPNAYAGARSSARPAARLSYQMSMAAFGFVLILFLLIWGNTLDQTPLRLPLVDKWSLPHVALMGLDGLLAGAFLAAGVWLRPMDQELFRQSFALERRAPTGLMVGALGAVCMPLALVTYVFVAAYQGAVSRSLLTVFSVSSALTLAFAVSQADAWWQTVVFGGNVIFLAMLLGWFIGDVFRPAWSS